MTPLEEIKHLGLERRYQEVLYEQTEARVMMEYFADGGSVLGLLLEDQPRIYATRSELRCAAMTVIEEHKRWLKDRME